jgi:hypothetical protein
MNNPVSLMSCVKPACDVASVPKTAFQRLGMRMAAR